MEDAGEGMPSTGLAGTLPPAWGEAGSDGADGVRGSVSRRTRPCDCCAALPPPPPCCGTLCCSVCCGVCCGADGLPRAGCPLAGRDGGVGCCMRELMPLLALSLPRDEPPCEEPLGATATPPALPPCMERGSA
jgi:hypothetical protein